LNLTIYFKCNSILLNFYKMEFNQRMEIVINYYKEQINNNVHSDSDLNTIADSNFNGNHNLNNQLDNSTSIIPETITNKKEYISKPCNNLGKLFTQKKRK